MASDSAVSAIRRTKAKKIIFLIIGWMIAAFNGSLALICSFATGLKDKSSVFLLFLFMQDFFYRTHRKSPTSNSLSLYHNSPQISISGRSFRAARHTKVNFQSIFQDEIYFENSLHGNFSSPIGNNFKKILDKSHRMC